MTNDKPYKLGQFIETKYTNPPVKKRNQYKIGQVVSIADEDDPDHILATFRVTETDDTTIKGSIVRLEGQDTYTDVSGAVTR